MRGVCTSSYDPKDEAQFKNILDCEKKHPADLSLISLPFSEAFADLFANIILNSPEAMSEYLLKRNGIENQRSFSIPYKIEGWDTGEMYGVMGYHHEALNPARYVLWQKFQVQMSKVGIKKAKEDIVKAMFDSCLEEIKKYRDQKISFYNWKTINQEDLNRELIQRLDQKI